MFMAMHGHTSHLYTSVQHIYGTLTMEDREESSRLCVEWEVSRELLKPIDPFSFGLFEATSILLYPPNILLEPLNLSKPMSGKHNNTAVLVVGHR